MSPLLVSVEVALLRDAWQLIHDGTIPHPSKVVDAIKTQLVNYINQTQTQIELKKEGENAT